jgi:hypothetical protein
MLRELSSEVKAFKVSFLFFFDEHAVEPRGGAPLRIRDG